MEPSSTSYEPGTDAAPTMAAPRAFEQKAPWANQVARDSVVCVDAKPVRLQHQLQPGLVVALLTALAALVVALVMGGLLLSRVSHLEAALSREPATFKSIGQLQTQVKELQLSASLPSSTCFPSPLLFFPFTDSSLTDASGTLTLEPMSSQTHTPSSAAPDVTFVPDRCERPDSALRFRDGGRTYLTTDKLSELPQGNSARSIALWVRCSPTGSMPAGPTLQWGTRDYNEDTATYVTWGERAMHFVGGRNDWVGTRRVCTGEWVHYAVLYNGTTAHFYLDGIPELNTHVYNSAPLSTPLSALRLGWSVGLGPEGMFIGDMDDVAIFNRSITASHVRQLSRRDTCNCEATA